MQQFDQKNSQAQPGPASPARDRGAEKGAERGKEQKPEKAGESSLNSHAAEQQKLSMPDFRAAYLEKSNNDLAKHLTKPIIANQAKLEARPEKTHRAKVALKLNEIQSQQEIGPGPEPDRIAEALRSKPADRHKNQQGANPKTQAEREGKNASAAGGSASPAAQLISAIAEKLSELGVKAGVPEAVVPGAVEKVDALGRRMEAEAKKSGLDAEKLKSRAAERSQADLAAELRNPANTVDAADVASRTATDRAREAITPDQAGRTDAEKRPESERTMEVEGAAALARKAEGSDSRLEEYIRQEMFGRAERDEERDEDYFERRRRRQKNEVRRMKALRKRAAKKALGRANKLRKRSRRNKKSHNSGRKASVSVGSK